MHLRYGTMLESMFSSMRQNLTAYHPRLPIIMAVMSTERRTGLLPFIESIRQQQEQLSLLNLVKVDMQVG